MHDPPETGIFAEVADVRTRPPVLPGDPDSWLVVETPSRRVALKRFGDVQVFQDEARQIDLVVHGELYDGASLPGLVSAYQDVGVSFVKECNGLFSILLIDRRRDRVVLATDRLGSKPLHVRRVAERTYVSSKLRHLVTCDSAPDRAGVAWYLSNGVVHLDRTILAEVSRVPRASCCTLSDGSRHVTRYWSHEFTAEDSGRSFEQVRGDLADLLVACVKKRPGGEDGSLLSLSAGNDSRGILGLLCHVGRRDSVTTFSYAAADDIAGSDAAIAKRLADGCGVPHRLLLSYDGELDDAIERNARWGDGSANFCDEALVWETLVSEHASRRPPLICGDTVLVDYKVDVADMQDAMNIAGFRDFAGLAWIEGLLPDGQYRGLRDAQAADLAHLQRLTAATGDLLDMRYSLYLDQRVCHVHLPWREDFAARGFAVQEPLLDNELLDFSRQLPPGLRRYQQRLYVAAASLVAPEVFTGPRAAVSGCIIDWRDQLQQQAASLAVPPPVDRESCATLLDDLIDPGVVGKVLRLPQMAAPTAASRLRGVAQRRLRREWGRVRRKVTGRQLPIRTSPADFLRRYLVLRRFLEVYGRDSLLTQLETAHRTK